MTGSGGVDTQAPRPKIAAMERGMTDLLCGAAATAYFALQVRDQVAMRFRR